MRYIKRLNPITAVAERAAQFKELLGPKVTLYLIKHPDQGLIWVEKPGETPILAKGLATFASKDKEVGFLSIKVGREASTKHIIHLFRDHGATVTSLAKNVQETYRSFESAWYTATMIPIALVYGEAWKRLG